MPLTDLACKRAKAKNRLYKLYDSGGLYLEVTTQGQRHWRMKYRIFGKEKRLSFGSYPEISLIVARQKREAAKELIRQSVDPSIVKKEEKRLAAINAAQTFELVARQWHDEKKKDLTPGYAEDILHRLELDVFSQIGSYPIEKVTAPILYTCIKRI